MEKSSVFQPKKTFRLPWINKIKQKFYKRKLSAFLYGVVEHYISAYLVDQDAHQTTPFYIHINGFDTSISRTLTLDTYEQVLDELIEEIGDSEKYLAVTLKEDQVRPLWRVTHVFKFNFNLNDYVVR